MEYRFKSAAPLALAAASLASIGGAYERASLMAQSFGGANRRLGRVLRARKDRSTIKAGRAANVRRMQAGR